MDVFVYDYIIRPIPHQASRDGLWLTRKNFDDCANHAVANHQGMVCPVVGEVEKSKCVKFILTRLELSDDGLKGYFSATLQNDIEIQEFSYKHFEISPTFLVSSVDPYMFMNDPRIDRIDIRVCKAQSKRRQMFLS